MKLKFTIMISVVCALFLLSSCSSEDVKSDSKSGPIQVHENKAENPVTPPELSTDNSNQPIGYKGGPVELVIHGTGITDVLFEQVIEPVITEKYPDIKLKLVRGNLAELFASGVKPDLISAAGISLLDMVRMDIPTDLSPMIKQFNVELHRIEPAIVEEMKEIGGKLDKDGSILGMPFWMSYGTTIYNKDIFDKFGYDYPANVLFWEDMLEYAKKMTREEDGIQFIGGSIWSVVNMFKQYGAPYVNSNNEPDLSTESHRHVAQLIQNFFDIPNYISDQTYIHTSFFNKGNVAVYPGWISGMVNSMASTQPTFEWDLTSFPVYKERPHLGAPVDYLVLMISTTSQHQEAAFYVINELLKDEVQAKVNQVGSWLTVLKDLQIKQSYAKELNLFEGKNLEAVFGIGPTPNPPYTDHRIEVTQAMNNLAKRMALEKVDINTALREGEEEAVQLIRIKAQ